MKSTWCLIVLVLFISCAKEEAMQEEVAVGIDGISVISSSYHLPFNEYGVAYLATVTDRGHDITRESDYFVDDQKLDQNIFIPPTKGTYQITSRHKNLKSAPIEVSVETPLNKKVLIELFTSRTCGFCPWIGVRLDSLQEANHKIISYSIHGDDELEVDETQAIQDYLQVYSRPAVRIQRGYVRYYAAPIEIKRLVDSVSYFLSSQPAVEIAIQSHLSADHLDVDIMGKFYDTTNDIYLSVVLVEDSIVISNQYNYFSGYPPSANPFISLPSLLPEYNNHNVLRKFLSDTRGDEVNMEGVEKMISVEIGSYAIHLDNIENIHNANLIAIVHRRRDDIEISSVLNSQIVKVGESIGFDE